MILAIVFSGLTSWYVGTYFSQLVEIKGAGDITVKDSMVKIMEANAPKIDESNQKPKIAKPNY